MSNQAGIATRSTLLRVMVKAIPAGYKRLILMSSLIAYLTDNDKPEESFIRNLDKALKLSRGGENALEFPVRLSKVFWGNREVFHREIEVLANRQALLIDKERAAISIVQRIPQYFIYESPQRVVDDIVSYFNSVFGPKPETAMA